MKRKGPDDDNSPERATKKMKTYLSTNQTPGHKEERSNKRKARPEEDHEEARKRKKTTKSPSQHYIIISSGSEESSNTKKDKVEKLRSFESIINDLAYMKKKKEEKMRGTNEADIARALSFSILVSSGSEMSKRVKTRRAGPEDEQEEARMRNQTAALPSQGHILISSGSAESRSATPRTACCVTRRAGFRSCVAFSSCHPSPAVSSLANSQIPRCYRETFEANYIERASLGSGGFGTVYAGYRREDMKPVAIKHIDQRIVDRFPVAVNGQVYFFPLEAMLMCMAGDRRDSSGSIATIALIDYFDLADEVILVMERPEPSMDLFCYITAAGHLHENKAKKIQKQLVDVAVHMLSRQVFHRDLKPANILLHFADGPHVKVIDFGCGAILADEYIGRVGTTLYNPPEMNQDRSYKAEPATVWQLAAVLYTMLHGRLPFKDRNEIYHKPPTICNTLSANCCEFLVSCLAKNLEDRPTLEELQKHPWLQGSRPGTVARS
ncbi:serine/threonine-protein kinase pim-1-like [Genypterus blacodes]|uniref:serine/threonine-protein kinase pim-1-like n=1 Tax=Genypterus blacodes TaxID=154954 RepID=UPI003F75FFAD